MAGSRMKYDGVEDGDGIIVRVDDPDEAIIAGDGDWPRGSGQPRRATGADGPTHSEKDGEQCATAAFNGVSERGFHSSL